LIVCERAIFRQNIVGMISRDNFNFIMDFVMVQRFLNRAQYSKIILYLRIKVWK